MIDKLIQKLETIQNNTNKEAFNLSFTKKELSIMVIGAKSYNAFSEALDDEIDKKRIKYHKQRKVIK